MDHVTSAWAREFGMPDPGITADEVLATQPGMLHRLAERGRAAAAALREGASAARGAGAALDDGWSTPAATLAVRGLARSADAAADTCDANAAAIDQCATDLGRTHEAIGLAYADADDSIGAQGLASGWPFDLAGPPPLLRARLECEVVASLEAAVAGVAGDARRAAARLCAAMGADPRPAGAVAAAPAGNPTSAGSDTRNRALLAADLASSSGARRAFAAGIRAALAHGAAVSGGAPVELLAYDPDRPLGQGSAAIAIGDVSAADSVAVLVPGVTTSPSRMSEPLDAAAALNRAAAGAAPDASAATVVWLGYDVPLSSPHDPHPGAGLVGAGLLDAAKALNAMDATVGGAELAGFCHQLRREMDGSAGLTLVGHSYGSTVVSQAALRMRRGDGINDIVLLAAPGAGYGVGSASGYSAVPADHVYALEFASDPVPAPVTDVLAGLVNPIGASLIGVAAGGQAGPFGRDPGSDDFGAQVIDARGTVPDPSAVAHYLHGTADPGRPGLVAPMPTRFVQLGQHAMGNYLSGAALAAVGAVVAGTYAKVPVRPRR